MSSLRKPTESLLSSDWRADDQSQLEMALRRLSPEQQPKLAGKRWAADSWPAILTQMPDNYRNRFQMFKKQAVVPKILAFYGAARKAPQVSARQPWQQPGPMPPPYGGGGAVPSNKGVDIVNALVNAGNAPPPQPGGFPPTPRSQLKRAYSDMPGDDGTVDIDDEDDSAAASPVDRVGAIDVNFVSTPLHTIRTYSENGERHLALVLYGPFLAGQMPTIVVTNDRIFVKTQAPQLTMDNVNQVHIDLVREKLHDVHANAAAVFEAAQAEAADRMNIFHHILGSQNQTWECTVTMPDDHRLVADRARMYRVTTETRDKTKYKALCIDVPVSEDRAFVLNNQHTKDL